MSYSRRFKKEITIHYSGSVSYPASQSGGTTSYSGYASETVVFDVTVDTDPFDLEVSNVRDEVDLLTDSVVATKAAHVKVIDETSRQVGDSIIAGFFKTVRSDISQQIAELKIRSESLLIQMNKLAQRVKDKQRQMGVDYHRLSERYTKIFTDLNKELENRIYSIDEPVFHTSRTLDKVNELSGKGDTVATVSVSAGETAHVYSMLASGLVKRQAAETIKKGQKFLQVQYAADRVIDKCLLPGRQTGSLSTPYCVMETSSGKGIYSKEIFPSPLLKNVDPAVMVGQLDNERWGKSLSESDIKGISDYFNQEVAKQRAKAKSEHDNRVAELTARLFNLSDTVISGE